MAGMIWVSDREAGIRRLFGELLPEAEVLEPDDLVARLDAGQRPDGLVIDGTQLLELSAGRRADVLLLPRVLVCTGMSLAALPAGVVAQAGIAALAKPFCVEDLEAALEWLRDGPARLPGDGASLGALVQRRRARRVPGRRVTP